MSGEDSASTNEQERQRLLKTLRESEILRELAELLASSLDLKQILQVLTQRTTEVCEVERCAVWLSDEVQPIFHPTAYYLSSQHIDQKAIRAADTIWQQGSIHFDDAEIYQRLQADGMVYLDDLLSRPKLRSIGETFLVSSTLLVALVREGRIVGMMSLDDPARIRTFSEEQRQLAHAIGQQAALAIDNARVYEQVKRERNRAERLIERVQAINQVAVAVNAGKVLNAVLEIAISHLLHGLNAQEGIVILFDANQDLRVTCSLPERKTLSEEVLPAFDTLPALMKATSLGIPLHLHAHETGDIEREVFQRFGFENMLIIPLMRGETRAATSTLHLAQSVGFVLLHFTNPAYEPTRGQCAFAHDIAAQCALAVEKDRLLAEQSRVDRRIRQALETLLNVTEAVAGITEIKDIMQSVLELTLSTLNCERGSVQLYNASQGAFLPLLSSGFADEKTESHWLEAQRRWLNPEPDAYQEFRRHILEQHAVIISAEHYPFEDNPYRQTMLLAAPILHSDRLLGVMMLDRSPAFEQNVFMRERTQIPREFTIWDLAIVEGIAQLAGMAIEQARWQEEVIKARSNEAALREANALKDEFLAITAHEFRTPLTVILAHSQVALRTLRKKNGQDTSAGLLENLTAIEDQTHQLTNIVNSFLEVTQLNRGQLVLKAEHVDLAEVIKQVVSEQRSTAPAHEIRYKIEGEESSYTVRGDRARLIQVIANLVQNAIKYSPPGSRVAISLSHTVVHGENGKAMIELVVADNGIGIPKDALPRLFERFYRAPNIDGYKAKGIGLGLYLVAQLLRLQGGTIRAESSGVPGEGSRFIITLPPIESE
jgi:signal transduction histidine kinase